MNSLQMIDTACNNEKLNQLYGATREFYLFHFTCRVINHAVFLDQTFFIDEEFY